MGKSTISMAIFNSYVTNYQRVTVWRITVALHIHRMVNLSIGKKPPTLSYTTSVDAGTQWTQWKHVYPILMGVP